MSPEFKTALIPYLFDGEFVTYMLQNIPMWPEIEIKIDDEEFENYHEPLDTEFCEFLEFTEDTLIISCWGDWQSPHVITIGFIDNEVVVVNIESGGFSDGIDHQVFEELFTEYINETPKVIKSLARLELELENAVSHENYEFAAELRDEILILKK
jgi:hypothetical protein